MCVTCGCSDATAPRVTFDSGAPASHRHEGGIDVSEPHHIDRPSDNRLLRLEKDLLDKNDRFAAANRALFRDRETFVINLVSSPGSGKTTLLARTAEDLKSRFPIAVIEGDQQTSCDAQRIREAGVPAIQVNTGKVCHLDAHMIGHAVKHLNLPRRSVLFIENVGNLVCPAHFDLGEDKRVVVVSVTEGEDKPLKYPDMFAAADLMLLNKIDLLPHLAFDVDRCMEFARRVNPVVQTLEISATTGSELPRWYEWIEQGLEAAKATPQQERPAGRAGL